MAVICFIIHGIGAQNPQYSKPFQEGVHRELQKRKIDPTDVVFQELYWANIGANDQAALYRKLYPSEFGASSIFRRLFNLFNNFAPVRSLSVNLLGDVFGYLGQYQESIKQAIFKQIYQVFTKLNPDESVSLILVGHSLGTVILHDLLAGCLTYKFAPLESLISHTSLITMGSPLSLFSLIASRIDAHRLHNWTNFVLKRDVISFPMGKLIDGVNDVYLKSFTWNPIKLHEQYWRRAEVHSSVADVVKEHIENKVGASALPPARPVPPEIFHPLVGGLEVAGLSQCFPDFEHVPFDQLISNSTQIDFCNIYGGKWLQRNAQYFVRALQKQNVTIRACIVSPKNLSLKGISYHFNGKPMSELKRKIIECTTELTNAVLEARKVTTKTGHLRIYRSMNMINHSFYRFDDVIYFTPRPLASSKHASTPIPCFAFRCTGKVGGAYEWLMRDFEELLKKDRDATLFYDSAPAP